MKQQLLERLKLIDQEIKNRGQKLQQDNADLNLLTGQQVELMHILNLLDQPKEGELLEPLHDINECEGSECDNHDKLSATA